MPTTTTNYWLLLAALCTLATACVPEDPSATPDTDTTGASTTGPPPQCHEDADCPDICVDAKCVECQTNADCTNPTPICVGEVCQGCSLTSQCNGSTPICENDACLPCTEDAQCQELGQDTCVEPPSPDAGSCGGCSSNDDCPPQYPECVAMQCTVLCEADPWEGFEPHLLEGQTQGGVIEGFVCSSDPTDQFTLSIAGPAFLSLELFADKKPGNVNMVLVDAGNVIVAQSDAHSGLEVIHVRVAAAAEYQVQVSLSSGPAGAPYELRYRTLAE